MCALSARTMIDKNPHTALCTRHRECQVYRYSSHVCFLHQQRTSYSTPERRRTERIAPDQPAACHPQRKRNETNITGRALPQRMKKTHPLFNTCLLETTQNARYTQCIIRERTGNAFSPVALICPSRLTGLKASYLSI